MCQQRQHNVILHFTMCAMKFLDTKYTYLFLEGV